MKKRLLSLLLVLLCALTLTGCSFSITDNNATQKTTIDGQTAIDRKSIADEIYDRVKDQVEADLYNDIYNKLLEEFGDSTITWETLQREIYNVVEGAAQSNVSVTNYKTNKYGEISADSYGQSFYRYNYLN